MTDEEDPLGAFDNLAYCPSCSCLAPRGTPRCLECGSFHMPIIDAEERIPVEERVSSSPVVEEPRDPGFYSIDPRGEIPEEFFEGDEDVVSEWEGASIDFGLGDDDDEVATS
ncbi:MAG: hypothetical protein CMA73_01430 [Euryarchaeota archaeon]|nr:hypothetical protein [Euryarchaeota archaeon]